jgi:hypothetical protein
MAGSGQSTTLYPSQISSPIPAYFPPFTHDLPAYTPSPLSGPRSTAPSYQTHMGRSDRDITDPVIYGGLASPLRREFERLEREPYRATPPVDLELMGGRLHPHLMM